MALIGSVMQKRALFSFLILACLLGWSGCQGTPDTMREGLGFDVQAQTRVFPAGQRATYEAARAALGPMGYRFVRGGPAEGTLEALSRVTTGESISSSEQFRIKATFEAAAQGGTLVSVKMTQILEDDSQRELGQPTESPLNDTPLYEVFFRGIQQELSAPAQKQDVDKASD